MAFTAKGLREWAEDKARKPGDRNIYFINRTGRMSAGDIGGPVFREAGKLEKEGKVMLFQRRHGKDTPQPGAVQYEARIPSASAKAIIAKLSPIANRKPNPWRDHPRRSFPDMTPLDPPAPAKPKRVSRVLGKAQGRKLLKVMREGEAQRLDALTAGLSSRA
jgi:hypothetical protein